MKARIARHLTALYPKVWRRRYQSEFEDLLAAQPSSFKNILNVARWAIYEHFRSMGEIQMDARQNSIVLMTLSGLAAVAAGINFYWTVDDTPLAVAMHSHSALLASWTAVQLGALALAVAAVLGCRLFFTLARKAFVNRQKDVIWRLAVPFFASIVLLAWLISIAMLTKAHWVPTPWDVTGEWTAPSNWPTVTTRWILGSVTFVLLVGGLCASAISMKQAVSRTEPLEQSTTWFAAPSIMLMASTLLMAMGVLSWGWFAEQYVPADFHISNGGLFSSTNFASWAATCVVMLAAAVLAMKSTRSALSLRTRQAHD